MQKSILFLGKEREVEFYQMLIGLRYSSFSYDFSQRRDAFYESISDHFAEMVLSHDSHSLLCSTNGKVIDLENNQVKPVSPLEKELVEQFSKILIEKIKGKSEANLNLGGNN